MSLHYLFVSCVVVIGVYVIFAVVAHTERGRVEFCISGMRWIACFMAAVFSVYEMFLKDPDISYAAISSLLLSVLSFQKEIISYRKKKNGDE